jgi:hypothetical protein
MCITRLYAYVRNIFLVLYVNMLGINRLMNISHAKKLYNYINSRRTLQQPTSSYNNPFTIVLL